MTVVEAKARLRALDAGLDLAARRIGGQGDGGDGEWLVPSVSRSGAAYTVRHDGGRWACSCPSGRYRGHCKHQEAVRCLVERGGR
jgi:hypothetical protein